MDEVKSSHEETGTEWNEFSRASLNELLCTAQLKALHDADAPATEYEAVLQQAVKNVVQRGRLWLAGKPYVFAEVEAYFHGGQHTDTFTHCGTFQDTSLAWYFHRHGKSYKGGTYKGVDITYGDERSFSGILIRSIAPEASPDALVEGSCCVVDHMLRETRCGSIEALVTKRFGMSTDTAPSIVRDEHDRSKDGDGKDSEEGVGLPPMFVSARPMLTAPRKVYLTSRVGLSLKRATAPSGWYLLRRYRASRTTRLKKGRVYMVTSLYNLGMSVERVSVITGIAVGTVRRYCTAFDAGKAREPSKYYGKALNVAALCEALGACTRVMCDGTVCDQPISNAAKDGTGDEDTTASPTKRSRQTTFAEVWQHNSNNKKRKTTKR